METAERFLFPKSERLCLRKAIDRLFQKGQSFLRYPMRILYLPDNDKDILSDSGIRIVISVPKKRIKQAVYRNRIKRLIREAYRRQKNPLFDYYKLNNRLLHIAFLYVADTVASSDMIQKAMEKALKTIYTNENMTE